MPQRLAARPQLRVRDEHRPERAHLLDQAREVGEVDPAARRDHVARRVAPGDLELLVVDRRPDLDDVAAKRPARLGADRDDDGLERRALLEARRHGEHAIERLARAPLELVQPGALECLTSEVGSDAGEGPDLGRDRVGLLERESHRPGEPLADEDRHRERARCVRRERRALGEPRDELGPPLHPRGLSLAGSRRDRRPGREWKARARAKRLSPRPARVDDHELLALDEPERAAPRADRVRHALDHHAGHFLHGQRCRERGGQRLQPLDAKARSLLVLGRLRGPLLPPAHRDPDAGDDDAEGERGEPADELVARRMLADMRGGMIAYANSAQPEMRAAITPGRPATHTATATAARSGA